MINFGKIFADFENIQTDMPFDLSDPYPFRDSRQLMDVKWPTKDFSEEWGEEERKRCGQEDMILGGSGRAWRQRLFLGDLERMTKRAQRRREWSTNVQAYLVEQNDDGKAIWAVLFKNPREKAYRASSSVNLELLSINMGIVSHPTFRTKVQKPNGIEDIRIAMRAIAQIWKNKRKSPRMSESMILWFDSRSPLDKHVKFKHVYEGIIPNLFPSLAPDLPRLSAKPRPLHNNLCPASPAPQ
jgi:hypothetical protein